MIKIYKTTLFIGLSMLLLNSCFSPQLIIKVQPSSNENVFWYEGQPIAEAKKDSIVTRAAFSHISGEYYIFDIEVFNEREQPFLVSPEDMFITISESLKLPAMDPEKIIFSMEMEASRIEARQKNAAIAAGVLVVGTAIALAVSDTDNGNSYDNDYYDDDGSSGLRTKLFLY